MVANTVVAPSKSCVGFVMAWRGFFLLFLPKMTARCEHFFSGSKKTFISFLQMFVGGASCAQNFLQRMLSLLLLTLALSAHAAHAHVRARGPRTVTVCRLNFFIYSPARSADSLTNETAQWKSKK